MRDDPPNPRARYGAIPARCLAVNLRMAARLVTLRYDEVMAPSGVRVTQFMLLVALALAGPAPLTPIAARLAMDRTTLTRNLRPLEAEGWVTIAVGTDRRTRTVTLTEAGRAALDRAVPYWEQAHAAVGAYLGPADVQELVDRLKATVAILRDTTDPADWQAG